MKNSKHVIFIGGIPGVGKTSISGYLAKALNIDIVLSGDYLREFMRPFFPDDSVIQNSVYDAWKQFGTDSRENIEKGFIEQAKLINKGFNSIFKRAISNGESVILESLYFLPSLIDPDIKDKLIMLYLYVENVEENAKKLLERTKYTHSESPGNRLADQLPRYRILMDTSMKECKAFNVPVFDTTDYYASRMKISQYIRGKE
ncbi:MAG: AAA family ATPase [Thermoplasmatales archaeon]|nr:AAA family ATPase [Thermoplasmatales archaeon]MCW6169825.1 AAA family ATPase [Thermoplasmatales archaeon]